MSRRLPWLLTAVLLLGAACATGSATPPEEAPAAATNEAPAAPTTTQPAAAPGDDAPAAAPTNPDPAPATSQPAPNPATAGLEPAPDFALEVQNGGGTFVLSEAATPVYLTFWAEW